MNPCVPLMLSKAELKLCMRATTARSSTMAELEYAHDMGEECNLWECEWMQLSKDLLAHSKKKGTQDKQELHDLSFTIKNAIIERATSYVELL